MANDSRKRWAFVSGTLVQLPEIVYGERNAWHFMGFVMLICNMPKGLLAT